MNFNPSQYLKELKSRTTEEFNPVDDLEKKKKKEEFNPDKYLAEIEQSQETYGDLAPGISTGLLDKAKQSFTTTPTRAAKAFAGDYIEQFGSMAESVAGFAETDKQIRKKIYQPMPFGKATAEFFDPVDDVIKKVGIKTSEGITNFNKQYLNVEDRTFIEKVAGGLGSMAGFLTSGKGIQFTMKALKVAPKIAAISGNRVHVVLESMAEMGGVIKEQKAKGMSESDAIKAGLKTFVANLMLIGATNSYLYDEKVAGKGLKEGLKKFGKGFLHEGVYQEGPQQIISDLAQGELPKIAEVWDSILVGGIVGGGTVSVQQQIANLAETGAKKRFETQQAETATKGMTKQLRSDMAALPEVTEGSVSGTQGGELPSFETDFNLKDNLTPKSVENIMKVSEVDPVQALNLAVKPSEWPKIKNFTEEVGIQIQNDDNVPPEAKQAVVRGILNEQLNAMLGIQPEVEAVQPKAETIPEAGPEIDEKEIDRLSAMADEIEQKEVEKETRKILEMDETEFAQKVKEEQEKGLDISLSEAMAIKRQMSEEAGISEVKPEQIKTNIKEYISNKWYHGIRKENIDKGDKFFSMSEDVAGDYADIKKGDIEGKPQVVSKEDMPTNPLLMGTKEELAEIIGYKGEPRAEGKLPKEKRFDVMAKKYAVEKGHDGIIYEEGSFDEPEIHAFEKDKPITEKPSQLKVDPLIAEARKFTSAEEFVTSKLTSLKEQLKEAIPRNIETLKSNGIEVKSPSDIVTFYHGTSAKGVKGIEKDGLNSNSYLASDKKAANLFASESGGKVIEIKVPIEDLGFVSPSTMAGTEGVTSITSMKLRKGKDGIYRISLKENPSIPIPGIGLSPKETAKDFFTKAQVKEVEAKPIEPTIVKEKPVKQTVDGFDNFASKTSPIKSIDTKISQINGKRLSGKITPEEANKQVIELRKQKLALAKKQGIAISTTPKGKERIAIRRSGFYAKAGIETADLRDVYSQFQSPSGMSLRQDGFQKGGKFGIIYKEVWMPTKKAITKSIEDKNKWDNEVVAIIKKHKFAITEKNGILISDMLEKKIPVPEKHKDLVKDLRNHYDKSREDVNIVRDTMGRPNIGYLENYVSHIQKTSIWNQLTDNLMTIADNFDFIIPNQTRNPFAFKRLKKEMKNPERNYFILIERYHSAMAKDMTITPAIENIKAYNSVLKDREMFQSAKFWDEFIRTGLLGKQHKIDNALSVSPKVRKGFKKWKDIMNKAFLAGRVSWNMATQPLSFIALTPMEAGFRNSAKAVFKMFSKGNRKSVREHSISLRIKSGDIMSDAVGEGRGFASRIYRTKMDKWNDFISIVSSVEEQLLHQVSYIAGFERAKELGYKGEDAHLFADLVAERTQSMYNKENRALILNSDITTAAIPFQSFAVEMWNHALEIFTKSRGSMQLDVPERIGKLIRLLVGIWLANQYAQFITGRKKTKVGTFIPFAGGVVDMSIIKAQNLIRSKTGEKEEYVPGRSPISLIQQTDDLIKASKDFIKYGDTKRLRKIGITFGPAFFGFGGGGQISNLVDGIIADIEGAVRNAKGKKLFTVKDTVSQIKAPIFGVWSTKGGRKYWERRNKK